MRNKTKWDKFCPPAIMRGCGGFLGGCQGVKTGVLQGLVSICRGLMECHRCLVVLKEPTFVLRGSTWVLQRHVHWGVTLPGCYRGPAALTGANCAVTGTWWCVAGACGVLQGPNAFISEVLHKGAWGLGKSHTPFYSDRIEQFFSTNKTRGYPKNMGIVILTVVMEMNIE